MDLSSAKLQVIISKRSLANLISIRKLFFMGESKDVLLLRLKEHGFESIQSLSDAINELQTSINTLIEKIDLTSLVIKVPLAEGIVFSLFKINQIHEAFVSELKTYEYLSDKLTNAIREETQIYSQLSLVELNAKQVELFKEKQMYLHLIRSYDEQTELIEDSSQLMEFLIKNE